jgi:hypothetical protein
MSASTHLSSSKLMKWISSKFDIGVDKWAGNVARMWRGLEGFGGET